MFALSAAAHAVVIAGSGNGVNLIAPASDPGWNNVAHLSTASAVYLGDRWMITANHVADAPVRFSDGRVFGISVGSDVGFITPGAIFLGSPDLRMFRLADDPGLPSLAIATASPVTAGGPVLMIGAGRDRGPGPIGWRLSGATASPTWNPLALPLANTFGFPLLNSSHMSWGSNTVLPGSLSMTNGSTLAFTTTFDNAVRTFEAQATTGDSGGGVFQMIGGGWKLVGIMDAVAPLANQPSNTVVFGESTLSIDMATYRDQIMAVLNQTEALWQNQANHFDVDRSGKVTPLDALRLINSLKTSGEHALTGAPQAGDFALDVNGDNRFAPLDVLQLINVLKAGTGNPSFASQSSALFVPEPSGATLAALGLLVFAVARGLVRLRRR